MESVKKIKNPSGTMHAPTLGTGVPLPAPPGVCFVVLLQVALTGRSRGGTFSRGRGWARASALRSQFGACVGAASRNK